MLTRVYCDKFRVKTIDFHAGLNVVLGDHIATNSIGKSNLLMVIDFAFGGSDFVKHNKDVPMALNHHDYHFCFNFRGENVEFVRNTATPELIFKMREGSSDKVSMSVNDYTAFLKSAYSLDDMSLSFRGMASLFLRIWGRDNLNVKLPLHANGKENSNSRIEFLIKLYKKYGDIEDLSKDVKTLTDRNQSIKKAYKENLIPKTTQAEHKKNLDVVAETDNEIEEIKRDLTKYAVNIGEIVSRKLFELKNSKDSLLSERDRVSVDLSRVRRDLSKSRHIKSKAFKNLKKFFPEADFDRLDKIENFHSKIANILKDELKNKEGELAVSLQELEKAIELLDQEIQNALGDVNEPSAIIDRVYDLSLRRNNAKRMIEYFETGKDVTDGLGDKKQQLVATRRLILSNISDAINKKIRKLVDFVYDKKRTSPKLEMNDNNYSFFAMEDTGTGKAYSNLVLLDLAVLQTTSLPFLIHDSVLFKNIENEAVANLVELYTSFNRQIFIAIDEIQKYGVKSEKILKEQKVIELSNESQLYIKDWREVSDQAQAK